MTTCQLSSLINRNKWKVKLRDVMVKFTITWSVYACAVRTTAYQRTMSCTYMCIIFISYRITNHKATRSIWPVVLHSLVTIEAMIINYSDAQIGSKQPQIRHSLKHVNRLWRWLYGLFTNWQIHKKKAITSHIITNHVILKIVTKLLNGWYLIQGEMTGITL